MVFLATIAAICSCGCVEAYLNSTNSADAFAGSHLPVQTHTIKQKRAHHDLMSLFVSAVKMLTVISYGGLHQSLFLLWTSESLDGAASFPS